MKIDYLKIARETVENFVKNKTLEIPHIPCQESAGVFVSIYRKKNPKKELRGCIGTYLPTKENVIQEIIQNAVAAATSDYRFSPVTIDDLPKLSYSVDILGKPERVHSLRDLNPKKYGVIIKSQSGKCGLLLPNIEGITDINQQFSVTCSKGNIDPSKEPISIQRFTSKRFEDK